MKSMQQQRRKQQQQQQRRKKKKHDAVDRKLDYLKCVKSYIKIYCNDNKKHKKKKRKNGTNMEYVVLLKKCIDTQVYIYIHTYIYIYIYCDSMLVHQVVRDESMIIASCGNTRYKEKTVKDYFFLYLLPVLAIIVDFYPLFIYYIFVYIYIYILAAYDVLSFYFILFYFFF